MHCVFTKLKSIEEAFLIQNHPRCKHKEFKLKDYNNSQDDAKNEMLKFLDSLEKEDTYYVTPKNGGNEIPKGIMKTKSEKYRVKKCINGIRYVKDFDKLEDAKKYFRKSNI